MSKHFFARFILVITPALVCIAALAFGASPLLAAPAAQSSLPDFTVNARTTLTLTVAITDGQVIVVPIGLVFTTENSDGETDVALIAEVEQQAGIFLGVAPSPAISATLQLPQSGDGTATDTTASGESNPTVQGTHVANRNSNRRSGPGTNFSIVGRVAAGGSVVVVGANNDGTWLELEDGSWVAEFLLDPVPGANNADNADDDNGGDNSNNDDDSDADDDQTNSDQTNSDGEDTLVIATLTGAQDLGSYVASITAIGAEATGAVDNLNALFGDPQPLSDAWRDGVAGELGALSNALDQYLALTPVPGYEALHTQVTTVALTCEQAVDYLVTGLNNPLAIDPDVATQSVEACSAQAGDLAVTVRALE